LHSGQPFFFLLLPPVGRKPIDFASRLKRVTAWVLSYHSIAALLLEKFAHHGDQQAFAHQAVQLGEFELSPRIATDSINWY
jgi:hypothetical protein